MILIIYRRAAFVTLLWHIDFGRNEKAKKTLHLELRRTCTLYISLLSKEMIFHYEHFAAYLYILSILTELHWVELRPPKVLFILWIPINIYYFIQQMWFFLLLLVSPVADEEISCLGPRPLFCARGSGAGFPGEKKFLDFTFLL